MIALEAGGLMDGKAGHDILIGLAGDNYLEGGDGHDLLIAVRGDNVIDGGEGQDTLVYWGGNRAGYEVTDKGFRILEIDNDRSRGRVYTAGRTESGGLFAGNECPVVGVCPKQTELARVMPQRARIRNTSQLKAPHRSLRVALSGGACR
jgi:Ca2+-binding RTX toxin-like protein